MTLYPPFNPSLPETKVTTTVLKKEYRDYLSILTRTGAIDNREISDLVRYFSEEIREHEENLKDDLRSVRDDIAGLKEEVSDIKAQIKDVVSPTEKNDLEADLEHNQNILHQTLTVDLVKAEQALASFKDNKLQFLIDYIKKNHSTRSNG